MKIKKNKEVSKYITMFISFFYIGAVTIGGGIAMLPIIEDEFVNKKKFLTKEELLDAFAISNSLPGVIAVNTSLIVGFKVSGIIGGIIACIAVILPSFIAILIIAPFFDKIQEVEIINKAFLGVKSALLAIILATIYGMGKGVLINRFNITLFILNIIFIIFIKINVVYVLLGSIFINVLYFLITANKLYKNN